MSLILNLREVMNWRDWLLPGLIWVFSTLLPGQVQELGSPVISNYETNRFGAHAQNWIAVQDQRGVMYFGNTNGLLEFDGQRWQFIPVPGNATTRALTCGPDGTIYYGSVGDFGYLAVSPSGKVSAVSLLKSIPQADRNFNDIWQALSSRYGIYFFAREKIFRLDKDKVHPIQGKFAPSQACLLNEIIFYADIEKGLCLLKEDQVVPIPQLNGVYNGKRIRLTPFSRHQLLAGRATGDFLHINLEALWDEASRCYDISRQTPKDIVKPFTNELNEFIKDSNGLLSKLIPVGSDAFAISTLKGGIVTFDRSGKIIRVINIHSGLMDNTVFSLFMDRSYNLWTCNNTGISHIELSVPQSFFGIRNNIKGTSICAAFHKDRLYVGTNQSIIVRAPYHFALQDDKQTFITLKNSPVETWQFLEFEGDLMAASTQGLFMIQDEEALFVQGSTPSFSSYCLETSKQWPGYIFVGLIGGIDVFRHKTGPGLKGAARLEFIGRMENVKDNIRSLTADANGDLWTGTDAKGLLRIHFSGADPTQADVFRFGPEQGLPGLSSLKVVIRDTTLFVLTPQGLFHATIKKGYSQTPERTRFSQDTTLGKSFIDPPVALNLMIFDKKGGAFFSTAEGVSWAIPENNNQYRMEARPFWGITGPGDSMYLHSDGTLWLPGNELFRVDLRAPKDYAQPFNVLIRKVITKSKRLLFEGTHGRPGSEFAEQHTLFVNDQNPNETRELPYLENAITFEFAAAFYEKPGNTQFQYLLEGFDKEWSDWANVTSKEYTNLPEGKYDFRVRARNIYGTMGREALYSLRILPPWYRTLWAYILWIIAAGTALYGIIYLYTLRLRRQKNYLEQVVAERTRELREASEKLREASLTDPLTGLRNRRFIHEVLQTDISAFIKYKHYLLNAKDQRRTAHEDTVFGLFLMDIDFFKKVNDTYGHDAGDQVLKQFAAILTGSVRPDDAVMRVGGEEFLVVLKKTIPDYLHVFAAKILEKVAATPFAIGGNTTILKTCSIGYTSFPFYREQPGLLTFEQSTMIADLGLFYAKNHGRNQAICLKAGPRIPSGEDIIQKTITSLEFALQDGYLQISLISNGPND